MAGQGHAGTVRASTFAVVLSLALALACLVVAPRAAWAIDGESANQVDPQLLPDSSFIYDTSIVDLSQADSYFDGQTVRVTGEVVGDRRVELGDPGHCWITLTDPAYDVNNTVEVFMSNEQASRIESYGAYGRVGSIVSVQGTFHLVCAEHGGASDVHADTISISSRGGEVEHPFDAMDFVPGLVACGAGLLMMVVLWYLRERGR